MNVLSKERQVQIVSGLVEGNSIRAVARMLDVEHKTVLRVLIRVGEHCDHILNERMRQLPCKIVQVDEIWTYVAKHEKRIQPEDNPRKVGDQYLFVAMDAESKLIPAFMVGKRNGYTAWNFVQDLKMRLNDRVQLTTDGFQPYIRAVDDAFGYGPSYLVWE